MWSSMRSEHPTPTLTPTHALVNEGCHLFQEYKFSSILESQLVLFVTLVDSKKNTELRTVGHFCNPNFLEAGSGGLLSLD